MELPCLRTDLIGLFRLFLFSFYFATVCKDLVILIVLFFFIFPTTEYFISYSNSNLQRTFNISSNHLSQIFYLLIYIQNWEKIITNETMLLKTNRVFIFLFFLSKLSRTGYVACVHSLCTLSESLSMSLPEIQILGLEISCTPFHVNVLWLGQRWLL